MNLKALFEAQCKLDEHIIREKGLEGQDLLPNTILALQVEIGELANEWRGFKHWSNDREMRTENALIEYVDCLHFILSIGLQKGADKDKTPRQWAFNTCSRAREYDWLDLIEYVSLLRNTDSLDNFWMVYYVFRQLGYSLGFKWEQIEEAYYAKNKINHQRQETGY